MRCSGLEADAQGGSHVHKVQLQSADGRMTADEQPLRRVTYRHALGESTGLPSASMDLVTLQFVIHEVTGLQTGALRGAIC